MGSSEDVIKRIVLIPEYCIAPRLSSFPTAGKFLEIHFEKVPKSQSEHADAAQSLLVRNSIIRECWYERR